MTCADNDHGLGQNASSAAVTAASLPLAAAAPVAGAAGAAVLRLALDLGAICFFGNADGVEDAAADAAVAAAETASLVLGPAAGVVVC